MKLALSKRCSCRKPDACAHDWCLRVPSPIGRVRVNVTKRYGLSLPMKRQEVEHHAAKAKHEAKSGLVAAPRGATPMTLGDIADRYMEAFASRSHHYLNGLRAIVAPAANGTVIPLESKPVDEVTTSDIKHAVKTWLARKKTQAGAQGGAVAERHLLQTARHLFNWAIKEGYATRTPFLSATRPRASIVDTPSSMKRCTGKQRPSSMSGPQRRERRPQPNAEGRSSGSKSR